MEFQITYTKEQEEFRKEVRAWLEKNGKMPPELGEISINGNEITDAQREWSEVDLVEALILALRNRTADRYPNFSYRRRRGSSSHTSAI